MLIGGQPTSPCTPGNTARDSEEYGSRTLQLFLKKLQESNHATSNQRERAQPTEPFPRIILDYLSDSKY
jgi:hypothetical protein